MRNLKKNMNISLPAQCADKTGCMLQRPWLIDGAQQERGSGALYTNKKTVCCKYQYQYQQYQYQYQYQQYQYQWRGILDEMKTYCSSKSHLIPGNTNFEVCNFRSLLQPTMKPPCNYKHSLTFGQNLRLSFGFMDLWIWTEKWILDI